MQIVHSFTWIIISRGEIQKTQSITIYNGSYKVKDKKQE